MQKPWTRTFYRLVKHNPPIEEDFWSHELLGRDRPDTSQVKSWKATSFCERMVDLKRRRQAYRKMGDWIAEVKISANQIQDIDGVMTATDSHFDITADPAVLLKCVVGAVTPIPEEWRRR